MAPRQDGDNDTEDAERARFSKKLDGYEAMGLNVDGLRRLLDDDIEEFRSTYLGTVRAQLEGEKEETAPEEEEPEPEEIEVGAAPEEEEPEEGEEEPGEEEPGEEVEATSQKEASLPEKEPGVEEGPSEEIVEEEADEDMELQLEGAGPEGALAAIDIPEDEGPEPGDDLDDPLAGEEEVEISIEEEREEETPTEDEPSEPEPQEEEPPEPGPEEEAEIEVGEAPEAGPEEDEVAAPEEPVEEDEALIVVAEVVEEPEAPVEGGADIHLDGLKPEERVKEAPEEEPEPGPEPEPGDEEEPKPAPHKRPVKKVVHKKVVPPPVRPERPATKKGPSKKEPAKKAAPKKEPSVKAPVKKKEKAPPPPPPKRRGISKMFIVIMVVAMLVIASAATYFLVLQNEDPIALFTFDPSTPLVGDEVTFDARNSYDPDEGTIEKYVWSFGDGLSGTGRVVKHSFIEAKEFQVRLTIEDDGGGRATTQRTVSVEALEISMERPLLGDLYQYDVVGNISLSNTVDGLFRFRGPTGSWEYIYSIDASLDGDKTFEVTGTRTAQDGFMKDHDNARVELTRYDLEDGVRGVLETSMSVNPTFVGSVDARIEEEVCQHWERSIRSKAEIYTDFSAGVAGQAWADMQTYDDGTFYSQLTGIDETFSLNAFLRETTFSSEDTGSHNMTIGDSTYIWKGKGMERVPGRQLPSLHINVTMDRDTLDANNLVFFFIDVWLEPGLTQPARYHVYVKGREEGNVYTVDLTETLGSESKGSDQAWGLPCRADHSYSHTSEYADDFNPLDRVPEKGGETGNFKFSPDDGYTEALLDNQFATFMASHPQAFFHLGNYTEIGSLGKWVMAFGEYGSSEHYEVEASGTSPGTIDTDGDDLIDDGLPLSSRNDIGDVVTLSRGLRFMRAEPEIKALCFDGNSPDWSSYTFNITEGVSTISLDPTSVMVGSQETGYVYMLVSRHGPIDHRAALDAINGQVLFTWKHSMTWDTLEGFG